MTRTTFRHAAGALPPIGRRGFCLGAALLGGSGLLGCARDVVAETEPETTLWRPILLAAPDAIRVPPPPALGSSEQRVEIDELLALQKDRTPADLATARFWNEGGTVRWNETARQLVAKHRNSHTMASRAYALLSVAQYDALLAAMNNKAFYRRSPPGKQSSALQPLFAGSGPSYPSRQATVAAASAGVLGYLFPDDAAALDASADAHARSRLVAGVNFRSDVVQGQALGRAVAAIVIRHAQADRSGLRALGDVGAGARDHHAGQAPAEPRWGAVQPWLMSSGAQFRAAAPPRPESSQFQRALAEVRRFSDNRTPDQERLAALWADGLGSYAPAGRWNKIAADLVLKYRLSEVRAGRTFALLNMALMDAGIAAWETKYHYRCARPRELDPEITTPVEEPNSPSFTCSHAAFSGAGAQVLSYLFPRESAVLLARAQEAAMSRVYGGIQFRFEGEAGLAQGAKVAVLAIRRAQSDGSN